MGKVEEVAAAIRLVNKTTDGLSFTMLSFEMARAAIEAMREPTQAMTKVAADDILEGPGISAFLNWQDLSASRYRLMIDAALSEDKE